MSKVRKPDITKGEWIYEDSILINVGVKNNHPLVKLKPILFNVWNNGKTKKEGIANAKAISAVPEMIDALIECYNDYKETERAAYSVNAEMWDSDTEILNKVQKALKKAGCSFE